MTILSSPNLQDRSSSLSVWVKFNVLQSYKDVSPLLLLWKGLFFLDVPHIFCHFSTVNVTLTLVHSPQCLVQLVKPVHIICVEKLFPSIFILFVCLFTEINNCCRVGSRWEQTDMQLSEEVRNYYLVTIITMSWAFFHLHGRVDSLPSSVWWMILHKVLRENIVCVQFQETQTFILVLLVPEL